jgi:hypothetical protein
LKAEILVKERNDLPVNMKSLFSIQMPVGTSSETLPLPSFYLELPFKLSWNIPYSWSTSAIIKDEVNHATQLVIDAYKSIHLALSRRDMKYISNLIYDREKEMSAAYYDDFNQGLEDSLKVINDTIHNNDFELQPLQFADYTVNFAAEGRVIYMHNTKFDQPIYFMNKQLGIRRELPFYFLFQDKQLKVCR